MNNIIVTMISKEMIKPAIDVQHFKPFKLSFLDQLIPTTYVPLIFFYPSNQLLKNPRLISSTLKISLSQTLTSFFPFSGRLKDNLFVHNFHKGVSFSETSVSCELSEFLQNPQIETLNQILPTQPCSKVSDPIETLPFLYIQLNTFRCGGFALGVCVSHKFADAESLCTFLRALAHNNDSNTNYNLTNSNINPNFDEASLRFPPFQSHQKYLSTMESFFFDERKRTTRRYVFDSKAISSLKEKAATENEAGCKNSPTRIKALSSFLWKCYTKGSASISAASKLSLSVHVVNTRKRTEPRLPEHSIGNIFWWAVAAYNNLDGSKSSELKDFAALTNESVEGINAEFLKSLEGEKGVEVAFGFLDKVSEMHCLNPEMFGFSSWLNFGLNEIDFGWGRPVWVSFMGEVGPAFGNLTYFKETMDNDGIEAWITLEDSLMEVVEADPEFLTFAAPNPSVI